MYSLHHKMLSAPNCPDKMMHRKLFVSPKLYDYGMIIPPKIPFQKSLTRNNLSFFFVLVKYLFRFTKLFTKYKYLKKRLIYVILFLKKGL